MELWSVWTHLLGSGLAGLTTHFGLSEAASIILLTFLARAALLPLSLGSAVMMQRRKLALEAIRPQLDALRQKYADNRRDLAVKTLELHREHGIGLLDRLSLISMGTQTAFGLGMFQTLKRAVFNSKFLWISTLARPDVLLTILVGTLMLLALGLAPGATSHTSMMLMLLVPVALSVLAVAALPSALGLYWATSNAVTLMQALALRWVLASQVATKSKSTL